MMGAHKALKVFLDTLCTISLGNVAWANLTPVHDILNALKSFVVKLAEQLCGLAEQYDNKNVTK